MQNKLQQVGFTLLEVLIALAILAISLTALLRATSEDIRDTAYLKNKTVALMLANNALTEVAQGHVNAPYSPFVNTLHETAFNQTYYFQLQREKTQDVYVDSLQINVFSDQNLHDKITTVAGFVKGNET